MSSQRLPAGIPPPQSISMSCLGLPEATRDPKPAVFSGPPRALPPPPSSSPPQSPLWTHVSCVHAKGRRLGHQPYLLPGAGHVVPPGQAPGLDPSPTQPHPRYYGRVWSSDHATKYRFAILTVPCRNRDAPPPISPFGSVVATRPAHGSGRRGLLRPLPGPHHARGQRPRCRPSRLAGHM